MPQEFLPLLPLRDAVVFPTTAMPLYIGRTSSIEALEKAMKADKLVLVLLQKQETDEHPGLEDLHSTGTIARVVQLVKLPDGTVKVLIEGQQRARLLELNSDAGFNLARIQRLEEALLPEEENTLLLGSVLKVFEQYVKVSKKVPVEVLNTLDSIDSVSRLSDTISAHLSLKLEQKQSVLAMDSIVERIEYLMGIMEAEIELHSMEKRIHARVKLQMDKSQRDYYLQEKIKAIHKELDGSEDNDEYLDVAKKIADGGLSKEATQKAQAELKKLRMMPAMSSEAAVVRNYLNWLVELPWKKRSRLKFDLERAQNILDAEHFGLEDVKERIIEYLAVQSRVKKVKGTVLCLVGPPGVGKTSLGQSIARAMNREFVRMALGGVRDEAEIRGHRRTYLGSMPGKIIQKMHKVEVKNPLILLDELDKMGMDHRGDPASALLEVLDPEQNNTFSDHYLEVDYDLSEVMFICTANSLDIPAPLLDRMEIIRLPGYTETEKVNIAQRYLLPKQIKNNGLAANEIEIAEAELLKIVRLYTKEAGVRGLERQLAKLCRRVVKANMLEKTQQKRVINDSLLEEYLGTAKYRYGVSNTHNEIGQVTGLAWTSVGGELLTLEAAAIAGKGQMIKTGSLGDVMQESIQTALTVVRSRAMSLGLAADYFATHDLHVHVPEGATPKDGPSAGIGMVTALMSVVTQVPVCAEVAMTGEVTLRGKVLAIGGLKEKLLAAQRGGIKRVIIPQENKKDLKEIPESILQGLQIETVEWIDQVLDLALETPLQPLTKNQNIAEAEQFVKDSINPVNTR